MSSDKMCPEEMRPMLYVPVQSHPAVRNLVNIGAAVSSDGLQPSQDVCANLRGLAQQMCYATAYGVSV